MYKSAACRDCVQMRHERRRMGPAAVSLLTLLSASFPPPFSSQSNTSSLLLPPSALQPYCPPSQRYDVRTFPPKCFDCPRIMPNQMQVAPIATTLLINARRPTQKFSPGLPQNQTCGCWRTPANQTFDIVLNASWIVTGLAFSSGRTQWLREFDVHASDDNSTFLPWGAFTMANFTAASLAVFAYPIRARIFRVTIRRYANHFVNSSAGFAITPVRALVSLDQPFACACPMLSSGACCPFINMTVRSDACVWCMDPADIMTKVIDGCGKCKQGTFEHKGKCYRRMGLGPVNSLSVGNPYSNGVNWRVDVNYSTDSNSMVLLFVTNGTAGRQSGIPCASASADGKSSGVLSACCLRGYQFQQPLTPPLFPVLWNFTPSPPSMADEGSTEANPSSNTCQIDAVLTPPISIQQFVQFDRGRSNTLSFTEAEIRQWAACDDPTGICTGTIGALFITPPTTLPARAFMPQLIQQPLRFALGVPPMVCSTLRALPVQPRAELHYYADTDKYTVRMIGVELRGETLMFQWTSAANFTADAPQQWSSTPNGPEPTVSPPPPHGLASLRLTDGITSIRIDPPINPVVHGATAHSTSVAILVEIAYGFGFSALPSPGDTDQIVTVTARSTQPARLKRLLTVASPGGQTTLYTTPKGFISDAKRVIDLGIACYQDRPTLHRWLLQAMQLLDTLEGLPYAEFAQRSCQKVVSGQVAKAYWLVPWRAVTAADRRTADAGVEVLAEFA